jgi:hypothetical protein
MEFEFEQPRMATRIVGGGVFEGREETIRLEQEHQHDVRAAMVRPRRVAAPEVPVTAQAQHKGIFDMWGRERTPEKKARIRSELNAAMREYSRRAQCSKHVPERAGLQLGTEVRAEMGLRVVHCEVSVAKGQRGTVLEVVSGVMGEHCRVEWEDGTRGCYSNLELRTCGHKRRHGPREDLYPLPSRPGPAPPCVGGPFGRPRGLMPPPNCPPALFESKDCARGAFRLYQYQPEVHKKNQIAIHDDLMQRADGWR